MTLSGRMIVFSVLLFTLPATAQESYFIDNANVSMYAKASDKSDVVEAVKTGDRLQVVRQESDYFLVETEGGTQGWIHKDYMVKEAPTNTHIDEIEREHAAMQTENARLHAQLVETGGERDQLALQVDRLSSHNIELNRQLDIIASPEARHQRFVLFGVVSALGLLLFLCGVILGYWRHKRRIATRLGGMSL